MVKTAEEIKEYQRLYYQKNKQKIDERRKEYLPRWRHNNEDYKSYHREYYQKNKNVQTIMLEINRALYLNEPTNEKSERFQKIKKVVGEYLGVIKNGI